MEVKEYRKIHYLSRKKISAKSSMIIQQIRKIINFRLRNKVKNLNCTVFSSDCTGGCILHDIGQRFDSPTVNLYFEPYDFIKFVCDLEKYMKQELIEYKENDLPYPVGLLLDIKIYFQHYESFLDAKLTWIKRAERIDYSKVYVIMDDHGTTCKEEKKRLLKSFEKIPYEKKVFFTNCNMDSYSPNAFYIKGFEGDPCCGNLMYFMNRFGIKYYDQFDYVRWMSGDNKC